MLHPLEEKDQIRDLLYRYCYALDAQRFDEIGEMFTEDGVFDSLLVARTIGPRGVVDFLTRAVPKQGEGPARKHCTVNTLIRLGDNEAKASSYMLFFRESETGIMTASAGRYEDHLVKQDGEWKFKCREVHLDLVDDPGLKITVDLPHSIARREA